MTDDLRKLAAELDRCAAGFPIGRVGRPEFKNAKIQWRAATTTDKVRALLDEHDRLVELLEHAKRAMDMWGAEEDGVPDYGFIGGTYNAIRAALEEIGK